MHFFSFFDRSAQEQEDDYEIKETDRCSADGGRDGMLHFSGKCTCGGKFKSECGGAYANTTQNTTPTAAIPRASRERPAPMNIRTIAIRK